MGLWGLQKPSNILDCQALNSFVWWSQGLDRRRRSGRALFYKAERKQQQQQQQQQRYFIARDTREKKVPINI